jgi:hypothetical protein
MSQVAGRRTPILVTGVPRSGTTWLARLLAAAPGTALAGREPMNPRGRQYALGGTLDGWARLTRLTPAQRRRLRLAYRGWNPWVYSRYGHRQWAGPLPHTRMVVKDPFAVLSIPAVAAATGARPVLVYRHPGAVLTSYRRMGWRPDLVELSSVVAEADLPYGATVPVVPGPDEVTPAEAMGVFWAVLHELALGDVAAAGTDIVVLSHEELAGGGSAAGHALADALGLRWTSAMRAELSKESSTRAASGRLHNFDRSPAQVAEEWRSKLTADEIRQIESVSASTRTKLSEVRFRLPPSGH